MNDIIEVAVIKALRIFFIYQEWLGQVWIMPGMVLKVVLKSKRYKKLSNYSIFWCSIWYDYLWLYYRIEFKICTWIFMNEKKWKMYNHKQNFTNMIYQKTFLLLFNGFFLKFEVTNVSYNTSRILLAITNTRVDYWNSIIQQYNSEVLHTIYSLLKLTMIIEIYSVWWVK